MDARPAARWAGAVCLTVAPLALTIGTFLPTYGEDDPVADQVAAVAAAPDALSTSNLLVFPQMLVVPAMFYLALLARRGAPRLSLIGGGLSVLGWLAGMAVFTGYGLTLAAAAAAPDRGAATAVVEGVAADTTYNVLILLFVLAHVVGMLVLGIGLVRSRVAPAWTGWFVAVLPVLHVGARVLGPVADGLTFALLTAAMAYLAVVLVRMPDGEWDLAPATARTAAPVPA